MRIMTIVGTRPEYIRLSKIIKKLDNVSGVEHILIDTCQNYDKQLRDVFYQGLGIRKPNKELVTAYEGSSSQEVIAKILEGVGNTIEAYSPDKILILGDTNTALSAVIARRMGVPVYHMEAGNRSHNPNMPEEINRRVVDQCSTILMPYTQRAKENLLREDFPLKNIFVTGNPIVEILKHAKENPRHEQLSTLGLTTASKYNLITLHRAEILNCKERLNSFMEFIHNFNNDVKNIFPVHPHTLKILTEGGILTPSNVTVIPVLGFYEFVTLEMYAQCIFTDSGTVQEEAAILGIPCVVVREYTERPEALLSGNQILAGYKKENLICAYNTIIKGWYQNNLITEYQDLNVSDRVINILLGDHQ